MEGGNNHVNRKNEGNSVQQGRGKTPWHQKTIDQKKLYCIRYVRNCNADLLKWFVSIMENIQKEKLQGGNGRVGRANAGNSRMVIRAPANPHWTQKMIDEKRLDCIDFVEKCNADELKYFVNYIIQKEKEKTQA
ncbi:hypothetical protein PIB30_049037 [Stylosanthes scabra]|uniref:Uncharacterized protein n=1 Tax=Stylosanthes scabra TaxID=79078 RepID=A0ABU6TJ57_9FABA|nr:hypothetical protein [Stylosanthes scabra]